MAGKNGKAPPKQYPFPRDKTRVITGPAFESHDTWDEARQKWFAYVRLISHIRQMDLPPLHKAKQ